MNGTDPSAPLPQTTRWSWIIWSTALVAFMVAVMNRTSLGVATSAAAQRFDIGASQLSTFVVVQVFVYAALQVPVGVLIDRVGSRLMIVGGGLVMAAGQLLMAQAHTAEVAVAARVLVGAGDAATFISLARLVPSWFSPRQVPLVTQLSGQLGQLGQALSAVPLVALLTGPGWTTAFSSAAALGVFVACCVLIVCRDRPAGVPRPIVSSSLHAVTGDVVESFRTRGTRLGLWAHFTVQYSGMVFALIWGYPFMVSGLGYSRELAGAMMTLMVLGSAVSGPVLGRLTAEFPLRRSNIVFAEVAATVAVWTAVLAWPGPAPLWLVCVLVVVLSVNGPTSMVGFDFARTFNAPGRLGSATGIVNMGGYAASLLVILLIGVVVDLRGGQFSLANFKVAWCVQYPVWALGLAAMIWSRRLLRREHGAPVDRFHQALWRHRPRRRR
jgi:MFS family permease